jgi:hypothetical protein
MPLKMQLNHKKNKGTKARKQRIFALNRLENLHLSGVETGLELFAQSRTSAWHIGPRGRSDIPDGHPLFERTDVRCYGIK